MMKRIVWIFLLFALAVLGAGCAATPPKFYTLSPTAEPGGATASYSVAVGPVSVPAMIDRPQMVVSVGPNQVGIDEFNRWASPLQSDMARVVAENLSKILGTPLVSVFPQSTAAGASYRVLIDVIRFESAPGTGTRAGWCSAGIPAQCHIQLRGGETCQGGLQPGRSIGGS